METFRKLIDLLSLSERRQALFLLLLIFMVMLLEIVGVGLVIPVLGMMSDGKISTQMMMMTMLGLGLFYTLKTAFLVYVAWCQPQFAFSVGHRLSQTLFRGYLRQPYTFHLQRNSAQLINNATHEVNSIVHNGLLASLNLLVEILVLVGIVALMLFIEPLGTVAVMFLLGSAVLVYRRCTYARILSWGESRYHHDGMRIQCLQQGLGGAKDVKLLGREQDFFDQYAYHSKQTNRSQRLQNLIGALPRLWLEWFFILALVILVMILLSQGRPIAQLIPTLGLFAAAAFRLMPSVNRMISNIQNTRYALPSINHLHAEITLFKNTPEIKTSHQKLSFKRDIQIRNLSYKYPKAHRMVLKDVNLILEKGSMVGFIGSSGAGKSTLIDLILGLLTPCQGQIDVDGQNIQNCLREWQNLIGYVPQSVYLTDDTLCRNVAFGLAKSQIDDKSVQKAIEAAQLNEFVASLPLGLETLVGERGIRLSGGQRQRIGIARALYHHPEVLILDEATSSLDTATEQGVMKAVTALQGEKTVLIVAHRLSTVAHCDRLHRLEQGKVCA